MRVYLSHSMRGLKGLKATIEDQIANCERAALLAFNLRYKLSKTIEIYVPAENEEFVRIAFAEGYITVEQILAVDCKIIDTCDVVLVNVEESKGDELQGGRKFEYNHAKATGKPTFIFEEIDEAVWHIEELLTGHN